MKCGNTTAPTAACYHSRMVNTEPAQLYHKMFSSTSTSRGKNPNWI